MKKGKTYGEPNKYDAIRSILREYADREHPISLKNIEEKVNEKGYNIGKTAVKNFVEEMAEFYVTEEECDELLKEWHLEEREIIFCKKSREDGRILGCWMQETISDSEWMFLMDSVLYSKILTKKEADNLAKRITALAGKSFSDLTGYRFRMEGQPYFHDNEKIDGSIGHIEGRVLKQVYLIREAIKRKRKVKFTLNIYKYIHKKQGPELKPYGKTGRVCSPYDVVYSNGRYYMLGADLNTERSEGQKYKLYRIDLMTDVSITKAEARTREEAGIWDTADLYKYRMENPYMFTGEVRPVRLRVDSEQFTQIVDWFGDNFRVVGCDADKDAYYDIEVKVNMNSFIYWVLQYSGCVQVLDMAGKGKGPVGKESFRDRVVSALKDALGKYEAER